VLWDTFCGINVDTQTLTVAQCVNYQVKFKRFGGEFFIVRTYFGKNIGALD